MRVADALAVIVLNAVKIAVFDEVTEADDDIDDKDENVVSTVIEVLSVPIGESVIIVVEEGVFVLTSGLAVETRVVRADTLADRDEIALELISVLALVLGEIDSVLCGVDDNKGLFEMVAIDVTAEDTDAHDDTIADLEVLELIDGCDDDDLDDNGEIDTAEDFDKERVTVAVRDILPDVDSDTVLVVDQLNTDVIEARLLSCAESVLFIVMDTITDGEVEKVESDEGEDVAVTEALPVPVRLCSAVCVEQRLGTINDAVEVPLKYADSVI